MADHMTQPLEELKKDIIADGVVDAEEVKKMRERLYADDIIDREEAEFLFAVNDAVSGNDNDPSWQTLFVEAISDHVLKDETSPNEVDEDEAQWLIERIQADQQVDAIEKALLENLQAKAASLAPSLKKFIASLG
jgi:hypothetical protein